MWLGSSMTTLCATTAFIHVAFRFSYFSYIGFVLQKQPRLKDSQGDHHARWLAFKPKASFILHGDAATFTLACVLGRGHFNVSNLRGFHGAFQTT